MVYFVVDTRNPGKEKIECILQHETFITNIQELLIQYAIREDLSQLSSCQGLIVPNIESESPSYQILYQSSSAQSKRKTSNKNNGLQLAEVALQIVKQQTNGKPCKEIKKYSKEWTWEYFGEALQTAILVSNGDGALQYKEKSGTDIIIITTDIMCLFQSNLDKRKDETAPKESGTGTSDSQSTEEQEMTQNEGFQKAVGNFFKVAERCVEESGAKIELLIVNMSSDDLEEENSSASSMSMLEALTTVRNAACNVPNFSLEIIENSRLQFSCLLSHWLHMNCEKMTFTLRMPRASVVGENGALLSQGQASIKVDLQHNLIPNSNFTSTVLHSGLENLRLIQMARCKTLDLGLLFGIPLSCTAAKGLRSIEHYRSNKSLFGVLCEELSRRDVCLLFKTENARSGLSELWVMVSHHDQEECHLKDPEAVLFQLATAEHYFQDQRSITTSEDWEESGSHSDDLNKKFIQASLGNMVCGDFNPLEHTSRLYEKGKERYLKEMRKISKKQERLQKKSDPRQPKPKQAPASSFSSGIQFTTGLNLSHRQTQRPVASRKTLRGGRRKQYQHNQYSQPSMTTMHF